nr:MAG TPA: hypothetical protein [Caudoviricetes sp.]
MRPSPRRWKYLRGPWATASASGGRRSPATCTFEMRLGNAPGLFFLCKKSKNFSVNA